MAESDILLREDRIRVVGGDASETEDGRETGDLEVTVGESQDPSITLNADWANVTLGGGDGAAPEGDIKLLDERGANRIQISAESDNRPDMDENRVWVGGETGELELGDGESGVRISAETSTFVDAEINVGGPVRGNRGTINGAADITAHTEDGGSKPAGIARFRDHGKSEPSVTIRGDSALLSLGYSIHKKTFDDGAAPDVEGDSPYSIGGGGVVGDSFNTGTVSYETVAGEAGKIFFDDGTGGTIRVIAEDGKLKIGGDSNYDGAFDREFLVVDPENEEIRTPWTFVEE